MCDMIVYRKRTMQGYANAIWDVNSMLSDNCIIWDLNEFVNLRGIDNFMGLPNLIDFKAGKIPGNMLHTLFNRCKYPNFRVVMGVWGAKVLADELSVFFDEIKNTLNDELNKNKPDYYAIRFINGLEEYAGRYKKYAKILTLLEELIYYCQTGKNPYIKWADGTVHRYSRMPRAHELLNNWVCKLLKVVGYYTHVGARNGRHKGASADGLEVADGLSTEEVEMKSPKLPCELNNDEAKKMFSKAVNAGLMHPLSNGSGYQWNKSNVLLAYFCGKIYCGDGLVQDTVTKEWYVKRGSTFFPETALMSLFVNKGGKAIRNLGQSRLQMQRPPRGYEDIDGLF